MKTLRSSRSQMFFKIAVFKNFAILSRKHLSSSVFLIKLKHNRPIFLFKRLQHRRFLKKFLRTAFFRRPYCSLNFFNVLRHDRTFWTSLCIKLTFFMFFVPLLWFPPWSMFVPYMFVSVRFACIKTPPPALFWLNH